MQTYSVKYLSFQEALERYCNQTKEDLKEVTHRCMNWQRMFNKGTSGLIVLMNKKEFVHYLYQLGSQWMIEKNIHLYLEAYLKEKDVTYISLDLQ
jgi:hypothetical protein